MFRLPITGKETVLDGVAQVFGLTPVSSKRNIWVARPPQTRGAYGSELKMEVDWNDVTQHADARTNYQLTAGDRIYVMGAPLVTIDTYLARILSPMERMLGFTLLGASTYSSIAFPEFGVGGR